MASTTAYRLTVRSMTQPSTAGSRVARSGCTASSTPLSPGSRRTTFFKLQSRVSKALFTIVAGRSHCCSGLGCCKNRFFLQWTAPVAGCSRFTASLNEPKVLNCCSGWRAMRKKKIVKLFLKMALFCPLFIYFLSLSNKHYNSATN